VSDADVALESDEVLSSGAVLFLKECEIVAKYLTDEADMR